MKTLSWSQELKTTVKGMKKTHTSESAINFSRQEQQSLNRAFGKTSSDITDKEVAQEWY